MAKISLTDRIVQGLPAPAKGQVIFRDAELRGLGVRVLSTGTKSFILDYMAAGRRQIFTIGQFGPKAWSVSAARAKAKELQSKIRYDGYNPAGDLRAAREAPTIDDLAERFLTEHVAKRRPNTQINYRQIVVKKILPALGNRKVRDVHFADVETLHRKLTAQGTPVAANLCVAVLRKMYAMAIRWRWTEHNPCRGVEQNPMQPRTRYLTLAEIASLTRALNEFPDQQVADIFRLLTLTGARKSEVQNARWDQFDLKSAIWIKPAHATKQAREHRVPLGAPALELLVKLRAKADDEVQWIDADIAKAPQSELESLQARRKRIAEFVFPEVNIRRAWTTICKIAGIVTEVETVDERGRKKLVEIHSARIHDLRHSFASILASSGASLHLIGSLLGHSQPATTARYSHLFDSAQRAAVETANAIIEQKQGADVVPFGKKSA